MARQEAERPGLYYGWVIVGVVFVLLTITAGLGFYNLSVYLSAFVSERGFDVDTVSGATSIYFLASGIAGLGVGALIEKYDIRWVIVAGALASAIIMASVGLVTTIAELYVFYILYGIAYSACALLPGTTLVARWFAAKRSIALSWASTGLSLGGIILTPLSAELIDRIGLPAAGPWIATGFLLIVPLAIFLLRPSPASMGLGMDGAPLGDDGSDLATAQGLSYQEAVRSRFFKLLTAAYLFGMLSQVGAISHQFRLVATRSDGDIAALSLAVMAGSSIVGRLIGGWALQWVPSRPFVLALLLVQSLSLALFALAATPLALIAVAALFGVTVGNLLMMQPLLTAEAFGLKAYGRIFSMSQLVTMFGPASGPALIGLLYEHAGGYLTAFFAVSATSLIAFALMLLAGSVSAPLADAGVRKPA